jgi:thioredoxin 1
MSKAMVEISERDFGEEVLECKVPVFACFTTQWYHNCYRTCPFADRPVKEYDAHIKFVRLDTEKYPEIAERYYTIAVLALLIFKNAQEVNRLFGFQDKSTLKPLLDSVTVG